MSPSRRIALVYTILLLIVAGAVRLPFDMRLHGLVAMRDFAMVYYAAFFFIGQAAARHEASRQVLLGALTFAFILLPGTLVVARLLPDFFLSKLTWRGVPLIYHKSDIAAAMLAAGFFWLWTRWEKSRRHIFLLPAGAGLGLIGLMASPRAAMVAVFFVTLWWFVHRRFNILLAQASFVVLALVISVAAFAVRGKDLRQTAAYSAYEHAVSILDFGGRGSYLHTESGDPGDNNRFRLVWWRAVSRETFEENPGFGLGFGYDLANRFLVDYDLLGAEDFSTRSPHSIVVTILGRMGSLGLVLLGGIVWFLFRATRRAFVSHNLDAMGLVSITWTLGVSACFGVVLEGPMGAVVFWTTLGLANGQLSLAQREASPSDEHLRTTVSSDQVAHAS